MDNLLYHYCSLETFEAIITNKTLRLSDITKSNDSMELSWLKEKILPNAIKLQYKKTPLQEASFYLPYKKKGISRL